MRPDDLELRNITYRMFVELGRAPSAEDVRRKTGLATAAVEDGWRRLHDAHALVLNQGAADIRMDQGAVEIRMANPFSAVPTAFRVYAADRWWYANCAWDAMGICAALHVDGRVAASCPDCGDSIVFEVRAQRPDDEALWFHCQVPAAHWWDDIGFT